MTRDVPRDPELQRDPNSTMSRRTLVHGLALAAGATMAGSSGALAQQGQSPPAPLGPPTTITTPPRDFGPGGAPTTYFWDPDVIAVDPSFNDLAQPNTAIKRLWTGVLWAEGPAWSAQGRYFVVGATFPTTGRCDGRRTTATSACSAIPPTTRNGNTFDFQGRQLSCEHLTRRVVRYEHDGTATVLADNFDGKKLNSPNDVVAASGRQLLVHRPALWRPALRGRAGRRRRPDQCGRQAQSADRPAGRLRAGQARTADQLLSGRSLRPHRPRGDRGAGARSQRALLLAGLQEALRRLDRQGTRRHRRRAARATSPCSTSAPTTSCPIRSCSATS